MINTAQRIVLLQYEDPVKRFAHAYRAVLFTDPNCGETIVIEYKIKDILGNDSWVRCGAVSSDSTMIRNQGEPLATGLFHILKGLAEKSKCL